MLEKRPTSYVNSNSVQVFSAYTFAAKGAPDWPGGQPGPQEGRFDLEGGKKNKSLRSSFILQRSIAPPPHEKKNKTFKKKPLCVDPARLRKKNRAMPTMGWDEVIMSPLARDAGCKVKSQTWCFGNTALSSECD